MQRRGRAAQARRLGGHNFMKNAVAHIMLSHATLSSSLGVSNDSFDPRLIQIPATCLVSEHHASPARVNHNPHLEGGGT